MCMKLDETINFNIFMDSKDKVRLSAEMKDIIHQIGLKIDECTLSTYIYNQSGF